MCFQEETFEGWRRGDRKAFDEACDGLWRRLYGTVWYWWVARGRDADLARQDAAEAFWEAMEELDLMVSGGKFLIEEEGRGKMSDRALGPRTAAEWRDGGQFVALARKIWILRCFRRGDRNLTFEAGADPVSPDPSPLDYAISREWLITSVTALERAAERFPANDATRQTIQATILYVKWKVAECCASIRGHYLKRALASTINGLAADATLQDLAFDGSEWRHFLEYVLGLSRANLDQRVRRVRPYLKLFGDEAA